MLTRQGGKDAAKGIDFVRLFQRLVIAQLIALMISPPATNILELLGYIAFFSSSELRARLFSALSQPMVVMSLVLLLFLGIGLFYSIDTLDHTLKYWLSWRRLLFVPLVVAAFSDGEAKEQTLWWMLGVVFAGMLLSYASFFLQLVIYKYEPGIVLRNHTLQGLLFDVAAFAAALMLQAGRYRSAFQRAFLWLVLILGVANILLINTSRSAYLALMVLAGFGLMLMLRGWQRVALPLVAVIAIASVFWTSPVIHQRIDQALAEASSYHEAEEGSSIGARLAFLQHTLPMVNDRPLFGYGTGGFALAYSRQVAGEEGWRAGLTDDPHNQYLKILIENGLVGLAVFLAFIGSFFLQRAASPWSAMGYGVLIVWCVTSLFNSHFSTFAEARFLMLWCPIMLAMPTSAKAGAAR